MLKDVAHAAGAAMEAAAEALDGGRPDGAVDPQHEAEAQLETLWSAVSQFPGILGRMVKIEDRVVEAAVPVVESAAAPPDGPALRALVEDQGKLATQAPLLGMHAKRLLEMAEQLAAQAPDPAQPPDPQAQAAEQLASLKPACEKASEHAPRIAELSVSTADLFGGADFAAALPQAEEIRRLLKEIRDLMPKDEQQQQDQEQEGEQDQKEQDPQQEGEKPPEQQPKPTEQDQQEPQPSEQEKQPPPKLTEQQAEQLLRQALAREQEFKDKMKELQKAMAVPVKVEKDW
jgi:hypothetical protein